jgi:hypothetical protein
MRPRTAPSTLKRNVDGSVDLYVGPKPPAGWEQNWIETPKVAKGRAIDHE